MRHLRNDQRLPPAQEAAQAGQGAFAEGSGFTPGPWSVDRDDDVLSPDGFGVAYVHGESCETQSANARLIAAAPEMLAALLEVRRCGNGGAKLSRSASDAVRAVIARAVQS